MTSQLHLRLELIVRTRFCEVWACFSPRAYPSIGAFDHGFVRPLVPDVILWRTSRFEKKGLGVIEQHLSFVCLF